MVNKAFFFYICRRTHFQYQFRISHIYQSSLMLDKVSISIKTRLKIQFKRDHQWSHALISKKQRAKTSFRISSHSWGRSHLPIMHSFWIFGDITLQGISVVLLNAMTQILVFLNLQINRVAMIRLLTAAIMSIRWLILTLKFKNVNHSLKTQFTHAKIKWSLNTLSRIITKKLKFIIQLMSRCWTMTSLLIFE